MCWVRIERFPSYSHCANAITSPCKDRFWENCRICPTNTADYPPEESGSLLSILGNNSDILTLVATGRPFTESYNRSHPRPNSRIGRTGPKRRHCLLCVLWKGRPLCQSHTKGLRRSSALHAVRFPRSGRVDACASYRQPRQFRSDIGEYGAPCGRRGGPRFVLRIR
jgi:hypothetical protein